MRRQFTELHPKDQTIKLNRKARIESNWGVNVQECMPLHIRPRMELKKGAKARVGDIGVSEEIWWNWSVELLRSLEELSTMTATKLPFAQELLHLEVTQRQQNPKHPQRKICELLLGDVQRVIDGMRRNQQQRTMTASGIMEEEELQDEEQDGYEYDNTQEMEGGDEEETNEHSEEMMNRGAHDHTGDSSFSPPHYQHYTPLPNSQFNPNDHSSPSNIYGGERRTISASGDRHLAEINIKAIAMRARSVRLRAQAQRLEADALDMEQECAELAAQLKST